VAVYIFLASSKRSANLCFDERLFLQSLYKVTLKMKSAGKDSILVQFLN